MKKDPEMMRVDSARDKEELKRLIADIKRKMNRVPASVVAGSFNTATAFKAVIKKAVTLTDSSRPTLERAREIHAEMARFYDKAT